MQAFYVCFLVVLVGSLVEARFFLRDDDVLEDVKKAVSNANEYLEKKNLADISTPDLSYSNAISSGSIKNARFGKLSSLYAVGDKQFLNKTTADVTVYFYDLNLGLEEFHVSYDYQYKFLYVLSGSGHADIFAKKNVIQLNGAVTKHADGSCSGFLQNAVLTELGDFEVSITPMTTANSILATFMQFAKNYFLPSDIPIFNKLFSQAIQGETVKKTFSEVACQSLKL